MSKTNCICMGLVLLAMGSTANATTFRFDQDPFAGSVVLTAPGRQILGGEEFINFNLATDVLSLESSVFGVGSTVNFANSPVGTLPAADLNIIVLDTFDDDNNPLTPFGASQAANLIASKVTTHGPGFFVYFNQSLDIPRLVYSTDLSSTDSDLRILARILNLNGAIGRSEMPSFRASNFVITTTAASTPEPSAFLLVVGGLTVGYFAVRRKRRRSDAMERGTGKRV